MDGVFAWITDGSNLAALVAAASAFGALMQYRRNSARLKRELAQGQAVTAFRETLAFLADKDVQDALSALDYAEPTTMRALRQHAATYESDDKAGFSVAEKDARDNMDQFLTRLEMMDFLIEREVISPVDFESQFAYWLELLGELPLSGDSVTHLSNANRRTLWQYIRTYRFHGVVRLFSRFGRATSGSGPPDRLFRDR